MDPTTNLEEEIWELREHTAQLQLELVKTQRRLHAMEGQLAHTPLSSSPSAFSQLSAGRTNGQQSPEERVATASMSAPTAGKQAMPIPEMNLKPLSMEERIRVVREYADRYRDRYTQKVIAAALNISTSTYNNIVAGRGLYARYALKGDEGA